MRSKASIGGHPLHPMLIAFPVAFLIGAFVADVAGRMAVNPVLWQVGSYLLAAGIVMALVAAIPGFVDYLLVIPPKSSAKQRATYHMVVNLTAVAIYAAAFYTRGGLNGEPQTLQLAMEFLATGLITVGGWLGGTLVFRNQIGVDHRYANAGKWKETHAAGGGHEKVRVASTADLAVDQMRLVTVGEKRIVIAHSASGFFAFDDRCTHKGGSLADGTLACDTVQCPWHGSQFDVRTGWVKAGPATAPVSLYALEDRGGELWLDPRSRKPTEGMRLASFPSASEDDTTEKELDMNVQQIMTENPAVVTPTDSIRRAAELLAANDCGCLPVVEREGSRKVVGVITDRDIALRGVAQGKHVDTHVRDVMSTDVATCASNADVSEVERVMSDRQVRRVVVVDDDGTCVGVVSQADLALAARRGVGIEEKEVARVVERISEPAIERGSKLDDRGLEDRY